MWRTLIVTAGEKLTVKDNWLHVYSPQQEARVPIGDLYSVVVDNRQALLSVSVVTRLAQAAFICFSAMKSTCPAPSCCPWVYTIAR